MESIMKLYKIKNTFVLIVFGASGDLAKLKLFPAIYALAEQNRFPKKFFVVGYARSAISNEDFQKSFEKSIKENVKNYDPKKLAALLKNLSYFQGQYNKLEDFKSLKSYLKKLTGSSTTTKLAYFSVPPVVFKDIIQNLGESKDTEDEDLRLIIEKPFGEDTKSARELFHFVARYFSEECIYLLDHYLGKSAVQSILSLRHSNRLLNLMMKGPEVANIQITAAESVGVNKRAGYFDQVGTLKDMVQSHLLQILALISMSIPISEHYKGLHREKNNILSALKFIESPNNISLGQYQGYKSEDEVPKDSTTETFVGLRLFIDRESWYKTPIYIRTGKKLHEKHTYVVVELKKFGFQPKNEEPNRLIFEVSPKENLKIKLINRLGESAPYESIDTQDSIACHGDHCLPEHALLLLEAMRKSRTYFLSFQEIIATWQITDNISNYIERKSLEPEVYKPGTKGPDSQDNLTKTDGFSWFDPH
jgi:glucose-6-phosphate 1-dehydrogenase